MPKIKLSEILVESTFNCRRSINALNTRELANSMASDGLLQPIVVKELVGDDMHKYKLIAGFRRTTAAKYLGWEEIDAVIKDSSMSELDTFKINLIENIQRKELTFQEEAFALQIFFDQGLSEMDACDLLDKSRGWIQARFIMLKLPEEILSVIHEIDIVQQEVRNLYTIYTRQGADACVDAFTKLYRAKKAGKKVDLDLYLKEASVKVLSGKTTAQRRAKREVIDMSGHLIRTIGNNPISRALGWTTGDVSDAELTETLKEYYPEYKSPLEAS
jgi:ParB/RepB/Spo0J family partition protein